MDRLFVYLARVGTVLAFVVVTLGAWVRLTDAGLGCPDWPGCYGQLVVSESIASNPEAADLTELRPLEAGKAWREMIHRYFASTLGLICVLLAAIAWRTRERRSIKIPLLLVALVIFQGLLGMWTVTLLLKPIVVVAHLLGGLSVLSLLFWLSREAPEPLPAGRAVKWLGLVAGGALAIQIFLGGWTSANYAALACPDFPTCQTQWWPALADFDEGFVLWRGIGIDYEGGVLDHPARVAVHFVHRLGAVLTALLVGLFAWRIIRLPRGRATGSAIAAALAFQLALGISIVVFGVPLPVAVAHNGMAALLLLSLINAYRRVWQEE